MLISESVMLMLQIWHHGFSHFLLPVSIDFMGMFHKFGCCLYAQIGVTSSVCLDNVNLLQFIII